MLPIADRHVAYAASVRDGWRPPGFGWTSTSATKRLDIRSAKPSSRRFPICWWSGTRKRPTARCRSERAAAGICGSRDAGRVPARNHVRGQRARRPEPATRRGIVLGGFYRFRPKPPAGRPHAGERTDQGARSARHRRHRPAAGHHAAAAGADDRQAEGARPGGDRRDGDPAGLPHHGLRALPVPGAEARPRRPRSTRRSSRSRKSSSGRRSTSTTTSSRRSTSSASWLRATRSRRRSSSAGAKWRTRRSAAGSWSG